jgi:hypothetical protein
MSAPYSDIRSAFVQKLQLLNALPLVAWENISFTPDPEAPYLKPALLPGEPSQAEIGTNGQNRHPGVYQISVFAPSGTGCATLNALRDALCDHFKRGTQLTYGDITVTVQKAYPGPTMQEPGWQQVPITILFRADAAN